MRKRPVYWCYFRAEILQIYKFLTEMILADNQRGKDRVPYNYLNNQDGVRQRQSFLVTSVPFCMIVTDPDNMQLHELILTQILIS